MPVFKVISNQSDIRLDRNWVDATKFDSKDSFVNAKGKRVGIDYRKSRYQIIGKKERDFSILERIGRGSLGVIATICTLSLGLFSKSVRNLFIKSKKNIRFAVLLSDNKGSDLELKFGRELYKKLDKKFINKIWNSNAYSALEKDFLLSNAKDVYKYKGRITGPEDWVYDSVSIGYLNWLALNKPTFSTIPLKIGQFEDITLVKEMENEILGVLPPGIDEGPRIYGHPLRVNGNHRTAFLIDMDNKTVEFFNSFGDDDTARGPLTALANALSNKYGKTFKYHHRTAKIRLQRNSYDCGILACKLIEERLEKGQNFNPSDLLNFDIAGYRNKVYVKAHKFEFFVSVGTSRYEDYIIQNIEGGEKCLELKKKIDFLIKNKFIDLGFDEKYATTAAGVSLNSIFMEYAKQTAGVPAVLEDLMQQAKLL